MSAALVIDIHSAAFWAWADHAHPGSVAATIDGNGMTALHTAGPLYFEVAGKWVTHPQGLRTNLQLTQVGDRRNGLIAWHPDTYKARLGQAQAAEFGAANRERRSPVTITKVDPVVAPAPVVAPVPVVVPVIPASTQIIDGAVVTPSTISAPPNLADIVAIRRSLQDALETVERVLAKG